MKRNLIHVTLLLLVMSVTGCSAIRLAENRLGYGVKRTPTGEPEIRHSHISRQDLQLGITSTRSGLSVQLQLLPYYRAEQRQTFTSRPRLTGVDIAAGLASAGILGWMAYDTWSGDGTYTISAEGRLQENRAFNWEKAPTWKKAVMIGIPADFVLSAILHTLPQKVTTPWEQAGEKRGETEWLRNHPYRIDIPGYNLQKQYRTRSGRETIAIRELLADMENPAPFLEVDTLEIRASTQFEGNTYTETLRLTDAVRLKPFHDFARAAVPNPNRVTSRTARTQPPAETPRRSVPQPPRADTARTPQQTDFTQNTARERVDPRLFFGDTELDQNRHQTINTETFMLELVVMDDSEINEVTVTRRSDRTSYPVTQRGKRDYEARLHLNDGENRFEIRVEDQWGNVELETVTLVRVQADTEAPTFVSLSIGEEDGTHEFPLRGGYIEADASIRMTNQHIAIRGMLADDSGVASVSLAVNEEPPEPVVIQNDARFEERLALEYGRNRITIEATDTLGNADTKKITIHHRPDRDGKDLALFFATDEYDKGWLPLETAIADAKAVASQLQESYGFRTKVVKNATKGEIMDILIEYQEAFIDEHGQRIEYVPGSQLLLYFAGHGFYNERTDAGYLVTRESETPRQNPSQSTALEHGQLRRLIDLIRCDRILVLMDTCFSGTFDPSYTPRPSGDLRSVVNEGPLLQQINLKLKLSARWCLTSASNEYVADEGGKGGHSPFAAAFLEALNTRGGPDNLLKLDEIWDKILDSKNNPHYHEVVAPDYERKTGEKFKLPEPRKGQFGAKELYEESDFFLFPLTMD